MVEYWKQAKKWEREYNAAKRAGGPTLEFKQNRSKTEYSLPQRGISGVPNTGRKSAVHHPFPSVANQPYKYYQDLGGPKGNLWGNLARYKGVARGAFGFIMGNHDALSRWNEQAWNKWLNGQTPTLEEAVGRPLFEQWGWMGTPAPVVPGTSRAPTDTIGSLADGFDYYVDLPPGFSLACQVPGWAPGQPGAASTVYAHVATGWYVLNEPCTISYSSMGVPANAGVEPVRKLWHMWTNRMSARPNTRHSWRAYGNPTWAPGQPYPELFRVPSGSPVPQIKTDPRFAFLPGQPFTGYDMPNPNHVRLPNRVKAAMKAAALMTGRRVDSGYNAYDPPATMPSPQVVAVIPPNGGGTITRPTNPEPPYNPGGKRDKKARLAGIATFQFVQKIFHNITEVGDLTGALYEALPKKYQTCKTGGPACEAYMLAKHWDKLDVVEAVVNVIANEIEDNLLGRFFGSTDKAARKIGTHGYKLLNVSAENGLVAELGNLYAEFSKEHVAPTKAEIVRRVKQVLGVYQ